MQCEDVTISAYINQHVSSLQQARHRVAVGVTAALHWVAGNENRHEVLVCQQHHSLEQHSVKSTHTKVLVRHKTQYSTVPYHTWAGSLRWAPYPFRPISNDFLEKQPTIHDRARTVEKAQPSNDTKCWQIYTYSVIFLIIRLLDGTRESMFKKTKHWKLLTWISPHDIGYYKSKL